MAKRLNKTEVKKRQSRKKKAIHYCLACHNENSVQIDEIHDVWIASIDDCASSSNPESLLRIQKLLHIEFWSTLSTERGMSDILRLARIYSDMVTVCKCLSRLDGLHSHTTLGYCPDTVLGISGAVSIEEMLFKAKYDKSCSFTN